MYQRHNRTVRSGDRVSGQLRGRVIVLVLAFLWTAASREVPARAQEPDAPGPVPGFQRDQAYLGAFPFEHINTASGNVLLTFTDFALPGYAGFDLIFQRTFNSSTDWTFGLAGIPMRVMQMDGPPDTPDGRDFYNPALLPLIVTPDGGAHRTWWEGSDADPVFRTAEFWRYRVNGRRLELSNGTECSYDDRGYLTEVRDRFENRIEVTNATYAEGINGRHPVTITQILGDGGTRTLTLTYEAVEDEGGNDYQVLRTATDGNRSWTYEYGGGGAHPAKLTAAIPPMGRRWSFAYPPDQGIPGLVVTLPQQGRIHYSFAQSQSPDVYGMLTRRSVWEGDTERAYWTFTLDPGNLADLDYSWVVDGPGVQYRYAYSPGAAVGGAYTLQSREVYDTVEGRLVERETRTYVTAWVTNLSLAVRNLLHQVSLTRDGQAYNTTLWYRDGTSAERFADYGRPWRILEFGEAGARFTDRVFDYGFTRHLIDKIKSETLNADGQTFTRSWEYTDETGFLEAATRYGVTTSFTPHPDTGAVATATDAHFHTTSFSYEWGVLKDTTAPDSTKVTRTINPDGTVASETQRDFQTTYEYDVMGRLRWTKPPVGHRLETVYDDMTGRAVTTRRSFGQRTAWTTTTSDAFGRVAGTENSVGVRTETRYDGQGRKIYEGVPYDTLEPNVGQSFSYDALDRVTRVTQPDDSTVQYRYLAGGDVEITDELGHVTTQNLAAFGDPSAARLVELTDAEAGSWSYQYHGLGQLKQVTQPGGLTRTWTYQPGTDRLASETHPESGSVTYSYDGAGRLETKTTPTAEFGFGYDAKDRLTTINAPGLNHDVTLGYDASDNRTLASNPFVTSTFAFDAANRLTARADTILGHPQKHSTYGYDGWDNVVSLTYPSGKVVSYEYDTANRPTRVSREPGRVLAAKVLRYHPSGAVETLGYGNNVEETFSYDSQRRWLEVISGGPLNLTYEHDRVGNVTRITDTQPGRNQSFTYDGLDRLRFVTGFGANEYRYDALGNRTYKSSPALTYTYAGTTKRLTSVSGALPNPEVGQYGYDGSGSLTSDPSGTYTYTPFGMLDTAIVAGRQTTYRYDPDHLRVKRVTPSKEELFLRGSGQAVLSEYVQEGTAEAKWRRDYVYLGSRVVAAISAPTIPPQVPPVVRFDNANTSVGESAGTVSISVKVDNPDPSSAVRVPYTLEGGTTTGRATANLDYVPGSGEILIAAGTSTGSMSVTILNDGPGEPVETFDVVLGTPTGATLGTPARHVITIAEDDLPLTSSPGEGDYVGDRASEVAVFRPSTATWHVRGQAPIPFGAPGDVPVPSNYNGDTHTELAVYRPSTGEWIVQGQPTVQFGEPGDIPVPADYNGDKLTDIAVYRPSTRFWYVRNLLAVQFGHPGDVPVPGDYDGAGPSDLAVYRPSTGTWYVRNQFVTQFGVRGEIPVAADYDGDGVTDLAVYRPSTRVWRVRTRVGEYEVQYGAPGDRPVPRDYDGDRRTDVAVYTPETSVWSVRNQFTVQHGQAGDQPAPRSPLSPRASPGDYDGDYLADVAVFRPSTSQWFARNLFQVTHVIPGDVPVPGDYDGDGVIDVAVYRPGSRVWSIRGQFDTAFGQAGDVPVPGDYDGNGRTDLAVYRPSTGIWEVKGQPGIAFGEAGDAPLPGDYDGDGVTDLAIYRPSTGMWRIRNQPWVQYGDPGDIPVPGDYDGDGTTDVAVYRPSPNAWWYIHGGPAVQYGSEGDVPVPADYNGDGVTDVAVYRPSTGTWYVRNQFTVQYGDPGDVPVVKVGRQ